MRALSCPNLAPLCASDRTKDVVHCLATNNNGSVVGSDDGRDVGNVLGRDDRGNSVDGGVGDFDEDDL